MNAGEILRMAQFESHYWWYKSLHALVHETLVQNEIKPNARMIDLGCGSGGLLLYLKSKGYSMVEGIDISDTAVRLCREKNLKVHAADVRNFSAKENSYDVVICNDVLYFLSDEDKIKLFQSISECLAHGGICLMNVPALNIFRGRHDKTVGITNRINKQTLSQLTYSTCLLKLEQRYWPFLLSPVILSIRVKQKMMEKILNKPNAESDLKPLPIWLNECLLGLTQMEKKLPIKPTIGSSLFTTWKKI